MPLILQADTKQPDGHGVELFHDRPQEEWKYTADGSIKKVTEPLDLLGLSEELNT